MRNTKRNGMHTLMCCLCFLGLVALNVHCGQSVDTKEPSVEKGSTQENNASEKTSQIHDASEPSTVPDSTPDVSKPDVSTPDSGIADETPTEPTPQVISFKNDIEPLLVRANCSSGYCHGGSKAGGFEIGGLGTMYSKIVGVKSSRNPSWTYIVPKQPEKSLIFEKISKEKPVFGSKMPIGSTLTTRDIKKIKDWILAGAPNN